MHFSKNLCIFCAILAAMEEPIRREKNADFRFESAELGFTFIKKTKALTNPRRHFHPWWEILYIISGERTFFYGNKTVQAKAGTVLIVAPGVLHRAINPEGETCSLYNLFFDEEPSSSLTGRGHFDDIHSVFSTLEPFIQLDDAGISRINALFEKMADEIVGKQKHYEIVARSIVNEIIVLVSRAQSESAKLEETHLAMSEHFSEILDWVNAYYKEPLSLESVAEKFNITASHLSRSFKMYTQFSFVEYVNSLRVAETCTFLRNSKKSVLEIAMKCGFGSVTQYGRWFKKLTGRTPLDYRKQ